MNFTPEQIAKAKAAKSAEELLAYAKEIGYPLTEEEAKHYFEQWHKEGELADEELDNVAGGTCYSSGVSDPFRHDWKQYAIVSPLNVCPYSSKVCSKCQYVFTDGGTWYCMCRWLTPDGEEHSPSLD